MTLSENGEARNHSTQETGYLPVNNEAAQTISLMFDRAAGSREPENRSRPSQDLEWVHEFEMRYEFLNIREPQYRDMRRFSPEAGYRLMMLGPKVIEENAQTVKLKCMARHAVLELDVPAALVKPMGPLPVDRGEVERWLKAIQV